MGEESQLESAGFPGEPWREAPRIGDDGGDVRPVDLLRQRVERIRLRADRILEELEARYGAPPPAAGEPEIETGPRHSVAAGRVLRFRAGRSVRSSPRWRR